ncbi:hypothetical protein ACSBR1_011060 [Camellia fascicularis]
MAVDFTASSVPHMNMPSSEPSVPPLHPTPCHAHQSDPFDVEHFGERPSMGLPCDGPSTAMPTPHFDPIECTQYTSQSSLTEIFSCLNIHPHTMAIYWNPLGHHPYTRQSSTLTTPDHLTVPSSLTPPQTNVDETMILSSPIPDLTLRELHDPLITHDFHIDGDREGQVHAPTRGTGRDRGRGRGRGRGGRRGRGRGVSREQS